MLDYTLCLSQYQGNFVALGAALAGIRNISSKVLGRTGNKLNNAQATIKALRKLKVK